MFLKQSIRSDVTDQSGIKIVYDDVAPYAKENSNPQVIDAGLCPGADTFPGPEVYPAPTVIRNTFPDLKRDDLKYPGYALCLPRFALLNGDYINFPDDAQGYGFISDEISDSNGRFEYTMTQEPTLPGEYPSIFLYPSPGLEKEIKTPTLEITFNRKFTSVGLLLTFNDMSGDFASRINVKWYSGEQLLSDLNFEPNETKYFCSNYVQLYDRIIITFMETSKPCRPVFLTRIDYGIYRDFMGDEIKEINCLQEINAISESISVNTMDFTVKTKSSVPFDLQKKQKLSLYFNGGLIGNFYLKNGARKSKTDYYMDTHDAVGLLDGNEFPGGIYSGQLVPDVISQIFDGEDFNYLLDETFNNITLSGYIPYTTKRAALMQIAFAIGAVVDTSNYDGVIIYPKQTKNTGEFDKVFEGLTLDHSDVVTGIRLTGHSYQRSEESEELYNDELSGTVQVTFSEAHHSLSISGGVISQSGDNYAIIKGTGGAVVLTGKKYHHYMFMISRENPNIFFNKNIKEVKEATLINKENAQQALDRVYEYYQRAENVTCEVILEDKVIGQVVGIDTDYDGVKVGTIERINYSGIAQAIRAEVTIHE